MHYDEEPLAPPLTCCKLSCCSTAASSFSTASGALCGAPFISCASLLTPVEPPVLGTSRDCMSDRLDLEGTGVEGRELRN